MKVVRCECGARNTAGGDCIKCGRPLGSIAKALLAGVVSATALGIGWGVFTWLTGITALWFPLLFGIAVSGAVAQVSFGRGWTYQAIATLATVAGIGLGETLFVLLYHRRLDVVTGEGALELAARLLLDDWALAFSLVGIMGGFWVWRQPSTDDG